PSLRLGGSRKLHDRLFMQLGYAIPNLREPDFARLSGGFSLRLPFDAFRPEFQYTVVREAYLHDIIHTLGLRITL
ncbi:hypothetical protein RZS08_49160, partial [Arthrospira platensis SPKY1]|nr:hypothetical protein [Arthrospira platensis SPKY1]